jgi:beta-galactosidase/beta-glucuronidase
MDLQIHFALGDVSQEFSIHVIPPTPETSPAGVVTKRIDWTFSRNVESLRLWFPTGYGDQPLYDFTTVVSDSVSGHSEKAVRRIGLRKVEMVTDAIATGVERQTERDRLAVSLTVSLSLCSPIY